MAKRPATRAFGLFQESAPKGGPLAERMRPASLDDLVGQKHILAPEKLLARAIAEDRVPSMILWGPPGCGKTSLARVVAKTTRAVFVPFSAVSGSVPELRVLLDEARERRDFRSERTILFVDEIHRFNKSQQDALLPAVERGDTVLIGATTENPSFSVNAALLSRAKVFHLQALSDADLDRVITRALEDRATGLGMRGRSAADDAKRLLVSLGQGDARRALSALESAVDHAESVDPGGATLTLAHVEASASDRTLLHDKHGDAHYDLASAFIKSMRGSDPDAALYWMMRLLEAGDDPLFVSRRMLIFASEDVGNADPRALAIAVDADRAFRRMGMPEGIYPLAHACLFLASVPKSDGVKRAIAAAREAVARHGSLAVPSKLRNAPTRLAKEEGHGSAYKYPHDYDGNVAPGETYLPDELVGTRIYEPTNQGLELTIRERLARLRGG